MIAACGFDCSTSRGSSICRNKWPLEVHRNGPVFLHLPFVSRKLTNLRVRCQDYCAPKVDYAEVRKRVRYAFSEKANEIADAIAVVQSLSAEGSKLLEEIDAQCS